MAQAHMREHMPELMRKAEECQSAIDDKDNRKRALSTSGRAYASADEYSKALSIAQRLDKPWLKYDVIADVIANIVLTSERSTSQVSDSEIARELMTAFKGPMP